jgi:hypothetical protein
MSKNRLQYQKGSTLVDFLEQRGTEFGRAASLFKPFLLRFLGASWQTPLMTGRFLHGPEARKQEKIHSGYLP